MEIDPENEITPSSGNVFADMGLPDAVELQTKVRLGAASLLPAECAAIDFLKRTRESILNRRDNRR
jgi:hypothetical protein